jgi:hypothetical protein
MADELVVTKKVRHFGRDRVELDGDSLAVVTPVAMTGWDVRRHRQAAIRFDGRIWRITRKATEPNKFTRYELTPWAPVLGELPGPEIEYSPDSIALHDSVSAIVRRRARATLFLNLIRPLTGFLPARTKDRLEILYGIDPVASTMGSIALQGLATLAALVLGSISQMVRVFGFNAGIPMGLVLTLGAVAGVDAAVRWSQVFAEVRPPSGFCEWLFRRPSPS